jgi:formate--tetrahydrofolate ligase
VRTDLEIAREARLRPINEVACGFGITESELEPYGFSKAKIRLDILKRLAAEKTGKYILVTAITPTPLGEGKTLTTVGLSLGMNKLGKKTICTLRQPSLGPIFGLKGGAAGGGHSQVVPMEDFNLHLTGDFHAVAAANNLLAAHADTSILLKNQHNIDPFTVKVRRVVDINDRALRSILTGCGGRKNGIPRETGFDIAAASEVMAILGLSTGYADMRRRLARIVVGKSRGGDWVDAGELGTAGAMSVILKQALMPTLMQTTEGTGALVHTGPFANIAHGNSSIVADEIALRISDYVITEAGFGADMGAEKFFNIKCRISGRAPDAAVIVATTRALKVHGGDFPVRPGVPLDPSVTKENVPLLKKGLPNLSRMIEIVHMHGVPAVVAVNRFPGDTDAEVEAIREAALDLGAEAAAVSDVHARGGEGGVDLAGALLEALKTPSRFEHLYPLDIPIKEKIETLAVRVYGAEKVKFYDEVLRKMEKFTERGYGSLPICMAKTQYSLSHDPALKNRPEGYVFTVKDMTAAAGAGFLVPRAGDIMLMPGLTASPALLQMDLTDDGDVVGLF